MVRPFNRLRWSMRLGCDSLGKIKTIGQTVGDKATVENRKDLLRTRTYQKSCQLNSRVDGKGPGWYAGAGWTRRKVSDLVTPPPSDVFTFVDSHPATADGTIFILMLLEAGVTINGPRGPVSSIAVVRTWRLPMGVDHAESIFEQVLELSLLDRAGFLSRVCAGDSGLRRRVEKFVEPHERAERLNFLSPTAEASEQLGDQIGRYKLLEKIGEGGCGVVYVAEQAEPVRRRVALKVIKLGMDTKAVIARFEAERQRWR
jgi:hypothetical protein